MLKFLECPDLHFNPAWLDTSREIFRAILAAAARDVDFVAMPGDLFDAPILASDKGGINELIAFVRQLRAICPIVAVYGTRSHDAPGSYGPLSEWVTVLEPGKMYGLVDDGDIIPILQNRAFLNVPTRALLFGIPEITKETYMADHPGVTPEQANADILRLVDSLIDNEIAPARALMPNVPAIGLLHGNVSDASDSAFETDNILKRSDIVIKTDTLERAGLTRWALGHIHTPWFSRKISAGYAGFAGVDRNPWAKTGFVPAMNLVTINDNMEVDVERIPYGTPIRVKINAPLASYDPAVAYWLDAASADDVLPPTGIHPWSKRTDAERTAVTRRVDATQLDAAKTLTDLARMFDPELPADVAARFDEIEKTVSHADTPPREITVKRVRVTGCTLFGGDTVDLDAASLVPGLTQLAGENGSGKSSLAGWCTPYPCFVGKNTDSGRQSAIKDFFDGTDASIEKWISFNGVEHHHKIAIKGAHTKTPKTECFFEVAGIPVQDKTLTFDEMMEECTARYGDIDSYVRTGFFVQPLQGGFESGLMTANMTTIRDLVQGIAGIDRTAEKRYALDKIASIGATLDRRKIEMETIKAGVKSKAELEEKRPIMGQAMCTLECELAFATVAKEDGDKRLASERARADLVSADIARRAALIATASTARAAIDEKTRRVDAINAQLQTVPQVRAALDADASTKRAYDAALVAYNAAERTNIEIRAENDKRAARLREIEAAIESIKKDHNVKLNERNYIISQNNATLREIALIEKPCPECGYIDADTAARVAALRASIKPVPDVAAEVTIHPELTQEYAALSFADVRQPVAVTLPSRGLSDDDLARHRRIVENAAALEAERAILTGETIPALEAQHDAAAREAAAINVEPVGLTAAETAVREASARVEATRARIATLATDIATLTRQLAEIDETQKTLDTMAIEVDNLTSTLANWKKVDAMLAPSKIPAMELDSVLDAIDREATHRITPYRSGRYMFQTVTQRGDVDKFDIIVIDKETGREKSFLKHSVGEKSFLNAAYTWALVKIRKQRMKTEYSPVILDEADSFIDLKSLPEYYEMQRAYFDETDGKALVITHSPEAGAFIMNHISMEEVRDK